MARADVTLRERLARAACVIRRVIGVPDYERYVAYVRNAHPELTPLSRDAFARDAMERRYDRPGSRCC
jgi:uncharacterized short protein YbdD (DUF466 family)